MKCNFFFTVLISLLSFLGMAQKELDNKLESYIRNDEFDKAKVHLKNRLQTTGNATNDQFIYYNAKASFVYLRLGILDSAMYYSKNALKKLDLATKDQVKYETWKSIAYSYCKYGKIDSAAIYTHKLYTAVDKTDNFEMIRYANILMGIISFQNKLFDDSLKYYEKALESTNKAQNYSNYKVDYYNLGLTHSILKNHQKGLDYLAKAAQLAEKSKDKRLLSRIYGSMADNYLDQGDDANRTVFLEKANAVAKSIGDKKLMAMGTSHQLEWDYKKGNNKKAYAEGGESMASLKNQNMPHLEIKNDTLMYVLAKKNNQTEKALHYLESFTKNKIKLLEQNGRKQIEEIKTKYELENKNLIINNQKLEIVAGKRINKITLLIITLLVIVFFFLIYEYRKKKKIIHLIYKKEKEKDSEIKILNARINSLSAEKNKVEYIEIKQQNHQTGSNRDDENEITSFEKTAELFEKFMTTLEQQKLFLNPELDQSMVVKIVGTNKKYLYESITKHSDLNFRGIINRLRIKEAKKIIENKLTQNEMLNISDVHAECGFNSNSSFYRTFKLTTGITPNEYALEFNKELV
ncbi:AraC family transcriptional regulator [Flavobacterium lacus]|nr:AraC family transcriptional regulator [Flavobacterium lacus]